MSKYFPNKQPAATPGRNAWQNAGFRPSQIGSSAPVPAPPAISGGSGGGNSAPAPAAPPYNPYEEMMKMLESQRAEQQRLRNEAAERAAAAQRGNYERSLGQLRQSRDDAQQQAYINHMMNKKDLAQQLSAQGITGGLAESTAADMYNDYSSSRAQTERGFVTQQGELERTLNDNLAAIEQQRLSGEAADTKEYYANLLQLQASNAKRMMNLQQQQSSQQRQGTSSSRSFGKGIQNAYYGTYQYGREHGMTDTTAAAAAQESMNRYLYSLVASGQMAAEEAYKYMT